MENDSLLPENDALVSIPSPLTPFEFKDRLIFGPSPSSFPSPTESSLIIDSFSSSLTTLQDPLLPQQNQLNSTASSSPAIAVLNDVIHPTIPKPQFGSPLIVRQAFVFLLLYLSLGVIIYWFNRSNFVGHETHPFVTTKLFSILFVLVGFGFIDILLSGMVSYMLDLQENYLLRTVQHGGQKKDSTRSYIIDVNKGRMRIRMKVELALGVVVLCIGIGVGAMHFVESLGWLDSFYLSVMSVTTVGYGDRVFRTLPGRLFATIWLFVSTLAVARAFLYLAEARVDKRHRKMTKWVLGHDLTISEFLAADIDNNGFVRYVITLADLVESHH
ncbi:hypothetical protein GOBAR_AA22889 [Gossypium barbadense]|uniref:Potassium channel domain-containing protein n=1 Tax=Gossypium barbadense TaxID=3634 RepID=A0A2P5X350_GOSBA|nr:hypothetical protein GOBAR_AA22889 [Gossypium barbadense]